MRAVLAVIGLSCIAVAQRWHDVIPRSPAGLVAMDQAVRDLGSDGLVLLVASHPDDRYVLPAVWLRRTFGLRVAVLLATRGGGGQNSAGSETGDAFERVRTLETEVGAARIGAEVWYLDRPDGGYRRSAAETFAEWGREGTLRDLVHLLREIRPDVVMTTHNAEEQHGHDLALVELLPEAATLAADPAFQAPAPPHAVKGIYFGGGSTPSPRELRIDVDCLDAGTGVTLRRRAYDVLRAAHTSPGPPGPLDAVFEPVLRFEPWNGASVFRSAVEIELPSSFAAGVWPGDAARGKELAAQLARWPEQARAGRLGGAEVAAVLGELRVVHAATADRDVAARLARRIEAIERLLVLLAGLQIEIDVSPGTIAVGGEEFFVEALVHGSAVVDVPWTVAGLDGVDAVVQGGRSSGDEANGASARATIGIRVPTRGEGDPMLPRFRAQRFVPPVRLRFQLGLHGVQVPVTLALPVEQRAPVELRVVPRMLLLPSGRQNLQFSVAITRNSNFPVEGDLEVRGPAGYAFARDRVRVELRGQRSDTFGFEVQAPVDRKAGVDVLRIRLGGNRIELPIHRIDVRSPSTLRVGLVRSRDDTLPAVLGAGGLGIDWSELSDADVAVADLGGLDSVVVDIRALRDRPAVRSSFRRLLDFAQGKGHRLVVLYQKDVEFQPPGEGFLGAPFQPFKVGKARVTRADAPVRVLQPTHALFQHPNEIRPADWDGWEQERGLYLPSVWSAQYEELLEIADPGQIAERGALLHARTGDGEYVYCALSLWRQLKKLHPGAVRLMANLITPATRQ